jgi:hypothetical protein
LLVIVLLWITLRPSFACENPETPYVEGVPYYRYADQEDPRAREARIFMAKVAYCRYRMGLKTVAEDLPRKERKKRAELFSSMKKILYLSKKARPEPGRSQDGLKAV